MVGGSRCRLPLPSAMVSSRGTQGLDRMLQLPKEYKLLDNLKLLL
jgi:hypothetical protein